MSVATQTHGGIPARLPLKQRGRAVAAESLRARCLARVRQDREALLSRLRELSDVRGSCADGLRGVAHEIVSAASIQVDSPLGSCGNESSMPPAWQGAVDDPWDDADVETLLALEQEIIQELERDTQHDAEVEAEYLLELQNAEDCALFEQHNLGGVPCPLCHTGRLERCEGELRCSSCTEMRSALMDEHMPLEDISELLWLAEAEHCRSGCDANAHFQVLHNFGMPVLYLCCCECGRQQVVL